MLDLEAIARDPSLIRRGVPDASELYKKMLVRHPRSDAAGQRSVIGRPTSDEVLAVRAWLAGLTPAATACGALVSPSPFAVADAIETDLRVRGAAAQGDVRYVSLAHLAGSCLTEAETLAYRRALTRLLSILAPAGRTVALKPIGAVNTIFAVSLAELGWTPERWVKLTRPAPRWGHLGRVRQNLGEGGARDAPLVVPGDWLAFAAEQLPSKFGFEPSHDDDPVAVFAGQTPIAALARLYSRDVDLRRAAAENGVSEVAFAQSLAAMQGPLEATARNLKQGTLSRAEAEQIYEAMTGKDVSADGVNVTPRVSLWTERGTYMTGDELSITVQTNRPCYLTLINIDTTGKATVLFPNDFERDTLLSAGERVRVPGETAPYLLRVKDAGRETFVAICVAPGAIPPGIDYDFEKQRFAMLGNWHNFMASAVSESIEDPEGESRPRRLRRRRGMTTGSVSARPVLTDIDLRAAISVTVR